jgi:adenine-specific DNA-methyltransferase
MAKSKKAKSNAVTPVTVFQHTDAARVNIPEATETKTELPRAKKPVYRYSPHLSPKLRFDDTGSWDQVRAVVEKAIAGKTLTTEEAEILRAVAEQGAQPWLEWANKQETEGRGSFAVDDVVLHVHERISPKAIISSVQREDEANQDLFARPKLQRDQAVQYYRHNVDWANRLILGDSLQVMSSLANRENLAGKVQMVYIDPPYGINFKSNWQNEVGKKDVKDKQEDLTRQPEMIKAYRDTWALGVHSYLAYLKERIAIVRDLLTESGSIFIQISEENVHRVRLVLDEVFGARNFVSQIWFRKKLMPLGSRTLEAMGDHLLWYARDSEKVKCRHLYRKTEPDPKGRWTGLAYNDGTLRRFGPGEKQSIGEVTQGQCVFGTVSQWAPSFSPANVFTFEFEGRQYPPTPGQCWITSAEKMNRLAKANRLFVEGDFPRYVSKTTDFEYAKLTNPWNDTAPAQDKRYVVQTSANVIERCMLITTDPGDLILDPTCGSGTSAIVAESLGRRWITVDSSRVSISIARQRILTSVFDAFRTKDPAAGVDPATPQNPRHGFHYKKVPRITLKSIAQDQNLDPIFLKHESVIQQCLASLNKALPPRGELHQLLVAKLKAKVDAEGARFITDTDLRRWLLPGTDPSWINFGSVSQRSKWKDTIPGGAGWLSWEVPFDGDPDWPEALQKALAEYRDRWRLRMEEVNGCIAAGADQEELVDKPEVVRGVTRVSGPFSVEGVRPEELVLGEDGKLFDPTHNEFDEQRAVNADGYIDLLISYMLRDGVTFLGNRRGEFANLEKEAGRSFHARGSWKGREHEGPTVAVVFGPQYGPVNAHLAEEAIASAKGLKDISDLVIAGFSFDAAAQQKAKEIDSPAFRIHLAHIRPDVSPGMQSLLKETPNSQLFTVFGQPDIKVLPAGDGEYKVEMLGVCVYNPLTGEISDSSSGKVAAWFLDADYDGSCFCFSQAFFPDKSAWEKIAKALGSSLPDGVFQDFTTSWPFKPGRHNRIAVKVIDPRGNEVMAIKTLGS